MVEGFSHNARMEGYQYALVVQLTGKYRLLAVWDILLSVLYNFGDDSIFW